MAALLMTEHIISATGFSCEEWRREMYEAAKSNLERDGYLAPIFFFLAPHTDADQIRAGLILLTNLEKDEVPHILGRILKETQAFACLMITETWFTTMKDKTLEDVEAAGGVSQLPDRREAVAFSFETATGTELDLWEIKRTPEGTPYLAEQLESPDQVTGRFTNLLAKLPKEALN